MKRYYICYISLILLMFCLLVINVCVGSVNMSLSTVWDVLCGNEVSETLSNIILQIRFPRAVAAFFLGGALALAGYILQTFFRNPIAGPFVLGISSGAKMLVSFAMVFSLSLGYKLTSMVMILAAFVGAMLAMGFVLAMSKAVHNMAMLIVAGVMIGYICSAITDFVVTFADDSNIVNLHNWSLGSFSGMTWNNVQVLMIVTIVCFVGTFYLAKPIAAYQLGESYARNMGVDIRFLRIGMVMLSSVLAACVTAFAGPISFVGVAVPHLMKGLYKTTKPIVLIPACVLGGGIFCLLCDFLSRMLFAPTELSVSTITAVFGAPIVLWIMLKRRSSENG